MVRDKLVEKRRRLLRGLLEGKKKGKVTLREINGQKEREEMRAVEWFYGF